MSAFKITVLPNGPLKVEGDVQIVDGKGTVLVPKTKPDAYLCRCGHSANKPFCDGAHSRNGFRPD
jgi:CDGSH-type Zn-finger protein